MGDFERNPAQKTLMGPGPSTVSPRVLRAMSEPTVGRIWFMHCMKLSGLSKQKEEKRVSKDTAKIAAP